MPAALYVTAKTNASTREQLNTSRERCAPGNRRGKRRCLNACYRLSCTVIVRVAGRCKGRESVAEPRVGSRPESGVEHADESVSMFGTRDERRTDERKMLVTRRTCPEYPGPAQTGGREAIGRIWALGRRAVIDRAPAGVAESCLSVIANRDALDLRFGALHERRRTASEKASVDPACCGASVDEWRAHHRRSFRFNRRVARED